MITEIVTENVEYEGSEGHELSAVIERPASGATAAWAVCAHCASPAAGT